MCMFCMQCAGNKLRMRCAGYVYVLYAVYRLYVCDVSRLCVCDVCSVQVINYV